MTKTEFAVAIGWNEKNLWARLGALGLLETCSRCGGSGHFSFCQQYGSKCFKCMSTAKQFPKFTAKLAKSVKARVEAGDLTEYLTKVQARSEAMKAAKGQLCEIETMYKVIGDLYTLASKWSAQVDGGTHMLVTSPIFFAQHMNNAIAFDTVARIKFDLQYARCTGDVYTKTIGDAHEAMTTLVAAWLAL